MNSETLRRCHYGCPGLGCVQNTKTLVNGVTTRYFKCDRCEGTWAVDFTITEKTVETRSGTPPRNNLSSLER